MRESVRGGRDSRGSNVWTRFDMMHALKLEECPTIQSFEGTFTLHPDRILGRPCGNSQKFSYDFDETTTFRMVYNFQISDETRCRCFSGVRLHSASGNVFKNLPHVHAQSKNANTVCHMGCLQYTPMDLLFSTALHPRVSRDDSRGDG